MWWVIILLVLILVTFRATFDCQFDVSAGASVLGRTLLCHMWSFVPHGVAMCNTYRYLPRPQPPPPPRQCSCIRGEPEEADSESTARIPPLKQGPLRTHAGPPRLCLVDGGQLQRTKPESPEHGVVIVPHVGPGHFRRYAYSRYMAVGFSVHNGVKPHSSGSRRVQPLSLPVPVVIYYRIPRGSQTPQSGHSAALDRVEWRRETSPTRHPYAGTKRSAGKAARRSASTSACIRMHLV